MAYVKVSYPGETLSQHIKHNDIAVRIERETPKCVTSPKRQLIGLGLVITIAIVIVLVVLLLGETPRIHQRPEAVSDIPTLERIKKKIRQFIHYQIGCETKAKTKSYSVVAYIGHYRLKGSNKSRKHGSDDTFHWDSYHLSTEHYRLVAIFYIVILTPFLLCTFVKTHGEGEIYSFFKHGQNQANTMTERIGRFEDDQVKLSSKVNDLERAVSAAKREVRDYEANFIRKVFAIIKERELDLTKKVKKEIKTYFAAKFRQVFVRLGDIILRNTGDRENPVTLQQSAEDTVGTSKNEAKHGIEEDDELTQQRNNGYEDTTTIKINGFYCLNHGQKMEYYCSDHKVTICVKCAITEHRKCEDIHDITLKDNVSK